MKGHFRQIRGRVTELSPLTIEYGGAPVPAVGVRGLTHEVGDLVVCLIPESSGGLPIALPLTRDF